MAQPKFTPGPWELVRCVKDQSVWNVLPAGERVPVGTVWRRLQDTDNVAESNARLVASAPELLEACKRALETLRNVPGDHLVTVFFLEAAIADAEAEERPARAERCRWMNGRNQRMSRPLSDHQRRQRHGLSAKSRAWALARQCPACQRKGAVRQEDDGVGVYRECLWCGWDDGHLWEQLGLQGPPQTPLERFQALERLALGREESS